MKIHIKTKTKRAVSESSKYSERIDFFEFLKRFHQNTISNGKLNYTLGVFQSIFVIEKI